MKKIITVTFIISFVLGSLYAIANAGGLGMTREDWEKDHFETVYPDIGPGQSYDGLYNVWFDLHGKVESFKIDPYAMITPAHIKVYMDQLTPDDSVFIQKKTDVPGTTATYTFFSEKLGGEYDVLVGVGASGELKRFSIYKR